MRSSFILWKYLFREVGIATLLAFCVLCVFLFYGNAVKNDEYFLQALFHSPEAFFALTGYMLPYASAFSLPLGFVVGLLLSVGRMSADKEILAMKTAGMGIGAIFAPVLVLSLIFTLAGVFLLVEWGPRSRAEFDKKKAEIILDGLDFLLRKDGQLTFEIDRSSEVAKSDTSGFALDSMLGSEVKRCSLTAGETKGQTWHDLRLAFFGTDNELKAVLSARSAEVRRIPELSMLSLDLRGIDLEGDLKPTNGNKIAEGTFISFESWAEPLKLPLLGQSPKANFKRLGGLQLVQLIRSSSDPSLRKEAEMLLHKNLALGFSPLCLSLVAMPLALRVGRRETMFNAAIALGFAMLFFFLVSFLPVFLQDLEHLRPALWAWLPNIASVCLGFRFVFG
tara:strand:- start:67 stop:1245 length:1179 start_codon:yes stop_codon:yes gene_type:complete